MVVTLDTQLPSDEELTYPELKLSAPALRAGAFHLGKYCQDTFNVRVLFSTSINIIDYVTVISFMQLRCNSIS